MWDECKSIIYVSWRCINLIESINTIIVYFEQNLIRRNCKNKLYDKTSVSQFLDICINLFSLLILPVNVSVTPHVVVQGTCSTGVHSQSSSITFIPMFITFIPFFYNRIVIFQLLYFPPLLKLDKTQKLQFYFLR